MEYIFKNSFMDMELTFPTEFRKYKFIEVKENFISNCAYFVYCKRTRQNYYAYFWENFYSTNGIMCLRHTINVPPEFQNILIGQSDLIQYNVYVAVIQPNAYRKLSYRCNDEYLTYLYREYKIYKCDKDWREYCEELNEEINKNNNYPIRKISHMREITDLIGSFL